VAAGLSDGAALALYSTSACHLCEQAEALILDCAPALALGVEVIDIADSTELVERYGVRIPVLEDRRDGRELGWPFDAAQLQAFVAAGG
jgi:hypothetical protein